MSFEVVLVAPSGREHEITMVLNTDGINLMSRSGKVRPTVGGKNSSLLVELIPRFVCKQDIDGFPWSCIKKWLPSEVRSKNPGPKGSLDLQLVTDKGSRDLRMRCPGGKAQVKSIIRLMDETAATLAAKYAQDKAELDEEEEEEQDEQEPADQHRPPLPPNPYAQTASINLAGPNMTSMLPFLTAPPVGGGLSVGGGIPVHILGGFPPSGVPFSSSMGFNANATAIQEEAKAATEEAKKAMAEAEALASDAQAQAMDAEERSIDLEAQVEELSQQNVFLESLVKRLAAQITKSDSDAEGTADLLQMYTIGGGGVEEAAPLPSWMKDRKHLNPLLAAYDERISSLESQLEERSEGYESLQREVEEVAAENDRLRIELQ